MADFGMTGHLGRPAPSRRHGRRAPTSATQRPHRERRSDSRSANSPDRQSGSRFPSRRYQGSVRDTRQSQFDGMGQVIRSHQAAATRSRMDRVAAAASLAASTGGIA
jgi:hypothetical protein